MVRICKTCGFENNEYDINCKKCGSILENVNLSPIGGNPGGAGPVGTSTIPPAIGGNPEGAGPAGTSTTPPVTPPITFPKPRKWSFRQYLISLIIILILVFAITFISAQYYHPNKASGPSPTAVSANPTGIGRDGIGVSLVNGEYVGISDGRFALDTNRPDGNLKAEAASSLRAGEVGQAIAQWQSALEIDSNDAEAAIYLQNLRVLSSGDPYITLVVGVLLSNSDTYSRDILQGAYIEQEECNDNPSNPCGVKLRLLIAKSGSNAEYSTNIAKQIVQARQFDNTIVGVLGWPTTNTSLNAIGVLASNHIPMIAASAAGDNLTGISPYFFRVTSTSSDQIHLLTNYIEARLKPQRLVTFVDPNEPYSEGLYSAFEHQYAIVDRFPIADTQKFQTGGMPEELTKTVQNVLKIYHPDVIFFTSINVNDMTTLLSAIPNTPEFANLKVVMGGSGYSLVEAKQSFTGYSRIRFAATAFPDAWGLLGGKQTPIFFVDYPKAFDPNGKHPGAYTFSRPTSYIMLGYDATSVFIRANQILQQEKQSSTPVEMRQAIAQIAGPMEFQGITGIISFDSMGNAMNKPVFILRVDATNHLQADAYQGCYFKGAQCSDNMILLN